MDAAVPASDATPDGGAVPAGDAAADGDAAVQTPSKPVACGQIGWVAEPEGLRFAGNCEGAALRLLPFAEVDGVPVGGGRTGPCRVDAGAVLCPAGERGWVGVEVHDEQVRAFWRASQPAVVQQLGLEGSLVLPGASAVLSNGLQSWSQSGVLALGDEPDQAAVAQALSARGESEVYRRGRELSWWFTFAGGGPLSFSAGALTADRFRSWMQVYRQGPALTVRLVSGAGAEVAAEADGRVDGEWLRVEIGDDLETMLRRYGQALPSRRKQHPTPVPAGWNSWYDLWDDVRADDIIDGDRGNADLAQAILGPWTEGHEEPLWIVVDDGWQQAWGTWQTNDKFPDGIAALAQAIEARGMRMGIWLAPLLVEPDSPVAQQHPEWLVGGATYDHPAHGAMGVLDVTHPGAAAHLSGVIAELVDAGVGMLKIDFLFAGTWEGTRHEDVTGMQAYARALALIREAAGEQTSILAVGAPPLVTFEYVDAWRVGNDIAFKPLPVVNFPRPTWSFVANQARQFTSRWPLCLATLCDADPLLLRDLPRNQVEAGAWVALATGGALFLSDDLTRLPAERRSWGLDAQRVALGLGGEPATPESFFPEQLPEELVNMKDPFNLFNAEHDVPSVWRLPDGGRIAFNFRGGDKQVEGTTVPARSVRVLGP